MGLVIILNAGFSFNAETLCRKLNRGHIDFVLAREQDDPIEILFFKVRGFPLE